MGVLNLSLLCYTLLCVHSSIAIIIKRKRKLVVLLLLSYRFCYYKFSVALPYLTVPWAGLWFLIVIFPDHTHLLLMKNNLSPM